MLCEFTSIAVTSWTLTAPTYAYIFWCTTVYIYKYHILFMCITTMSVLHWQFGFERLWRKSDISTGKIQCAHFVTAVWVLFVLVLAFLRRPQSPSHAYLIVLYIYVHSPCLQALMGKLGTDSRMIRSYGLRLVLHTKGEGNMVSGKHTRTIRCVLVAVVVVKVVTSHFRWCLWYVCVCSSQPQKIYF